MAVLTRGRKAWERIVDDDALWAEVRKAAIKAAMPMFRELYLGGIELGVRLWRRERRRARKQEDLGALVDDLGASAASYLTAYANEWWQGLEATTRTQLADIITTARREAWSLDRIIQEVAKLFGPGRAEIIAVTETTRLFGAGAQASYRAIGVEQWNWRTAEDGRVDEICIVRRDGSPYPMDVPFEPPHPRCLPGYARVSAPGITATSERWYDGDLVVIDTASGNHLAVTPNHPVLTPPGWIAAGRLHAGGHVVACRGGEWKGVSACIEEIAAAFGPSERSVELIQSAAMFHGDGTEGAAGRIQQKERGVIDSVLSARHSINEFTGRFGGFETDDIVGIERRPFHGLVYNLQAPGGWYVAEGIVTHNCRCWPTPLVTTETA